MALSTDDNVRTKYYGSNRKAGSERVNTNTMLSEKTDDKIICNQEMLLAALTPKFCAGSCQQ